MSVPAIWTLPLCRAWKPCWTWSITPKRPRSSSGPRKPGSRWPPAAWKCWWHRPCTRRSISSTASLRMPRRKFPASRRPSGGIRSMSSSSGCPPPANPPSGGCWPKSWASAFLISTTRWSRPTAAPSRRSLPPRARTASAGKRRSRSPGLPKRGGSCSPAGAASSSGLRISGCCTRTASSSFWTARWKR